MALVGPETTGERVAVLFHGNKGAIRCPLNQVRRRRSEMVELRLNRANEQSVLIDAELTPDEVASLAIKVNTHLQGLASEINDGDCV